MLEVYKPKRKSKMFILALLIALLGIGVFGYQYGQYKEKQRSLQFVQLKLMQAYEMGFYKGYYHATRQIPEQESFSGGKDKQCREAL